MSCMNNSSNIGRVISCHTLDGEEEIWVKRPIPGSIFLVWGYLVCPASDSKMHWGVGYFGEVRHSRGELTFDGLDAENGIYPVLSGVKFIQAVHWAWDSQSGASWEGNIDQYLQQEGTCMKAGWEKLHCDNGSEGVRWSLKGCLSC